jgi:hypothetical protein
MKKGRYVDFFGQNRHREEQQEKDLNLAEVESL